MCEQERTGTYRMILGIARKVDQLLQCLRHERGLVERGINVDPKRSRIVSSSNPVSAISNTLNETEGQPYHMRSMAAGMKPSMTVETTTGLAIRIDSVAQ